MRRCARVWCEANQALTENVSSLSRCQVDLSSLSKEHTHKLEMPLEEGEGCLVLLVTLTASAAVTISDLSVNSLEDQKEREEILKRYVRSSSLLPFAGKMFACINNNYIRGGG